LTTPSPGLAADRTKTRTFSRVLYCNNLKADLTVSEFRKWVKVRVIRNLMTMGFFASDLSLSA
jgi:hypothetical protein